MRRAALAVAVALASCAGPVVAPPEAPPPSSTPSPPVLAEIPDSAPAPITHPELLYTGARATRLARHAGIARGVFDAYADQHPQPVTRGFAATQFVQFETDRRDPGTLVWVEASTTALHGAPDVAERVEPCGTPLSVGEEIRLPRGRAKLLRREDHDELLVADAKGELRPAKLPRGVSRGACAGPDGSRVWLGWETPESPSELWSVSLRDGTTRALRVDARPGLGGLGDIKTGAEQVDEGTVAAFLEPLLPARRAALLVAATKDPLAAWDPLARVLLEAGVAVLLVRSPTAAALGAARRRWSVPTVTIARELPASTPGDAPLVLLTPPESSGNAGSLADGSVIIGIGDASREPLAKALAQTRNDIRWTIAEGSSARVSVSSAWARAADAALGEP